MPVARQAEDRAQRARAAALIKDENKARAGLSRTLKLRLYPKPAQAAMIRRIIGVQRFVWNNIWLPLVEEAAKARRLLAESSGGTAEAREEAWRIHPNPTSTMLTHAIREAVKPGSGTEWIADVPQTPFHRAARNFVDALKASHGRTRSGAKRKVKAGRIRPRHRRDDPRAGIEWQRQDRNNPLRGMTLSKVIDLAAGTVMVPSIGPIPFADRRRLLGRYFAIPTAEACELTIKRDGGHFYACIAVRGLPEGEHHHRPGSSIGIDMGVANPLATSDGELVTHHQGHEITRHLARLEKRKLRAKRQYARKLHAAATKAGAVTGTGSFKKGVPIPNSNRMKRLIERQNKIDRQIVGYRADWQRKRALEIVTHSEIVVVEALTSSASTTGSAAAIGKNRSQCTREVWPQSIYPGARLGLNARAAKKQG